MIVWYLDLQQHVQSVPMTTKDVSWNPVHVLNTTVCDKVCRILVLIVINMEKTYQNLFHKHHVDRQVR
jgi:hypothetical protein